MWRLSLVYLVFLGVLFNILLILNMSMTSAPTSIQKKSLKTVMSLINQRNGTVSILYANMVTLKNTDLIP